MTRFERNARPIRLGMLTPSSNTVLEPVTTAMIHGLAGVSCHFARFRVTRISLEEDDLRQFDIATIVAAAEMLADARVDVIGWSGTSGSWLGTAQDRALCAAIEASTGIVATTAALAMNEILAATGAAKVALVTPYTDDVQAKIIANYRALGIDCSIERHLGDPGNFSFADWSEDDIERMIRDVAAERPDAIMVMCTNFRAAPLADRLERALGIPIYDSIAAVVGKSLALAGMQPDAVSGWGSLFRTIPRSEPLASVTR